MKVVHINTIDTGGAAIAAYRIHKGLQEAGIDSSMLVLKKTLPDPSVKPFSGISEGNLLLQGLFDRWQSFDTKYINRPKGLELFSDAESAVKLSHFPEIRAADIIHLHWVAGVLDLDDLPQLCNRKQVVWTLHDMNAFTGGCHYSGRCIKYTHNCGACPQLGENNDEDLSRRIWERKHEAYKKIKLTLAAPSRWLGSCIQSSTLMGRFTTQIVPSSLPLHIFQPRPRALIRKRLGIPQSSNIILFGAQVTDNRRKGLKYLIQSLNLLGRAQYRPENLVLLVFGANAGLNNNHFPFRIVSVGEIDDQLLLSQLYSTANLFVIPSLEDNLPNTAIEALACGTPVVGFDSGGIADIVDHKHNGYLAATGDTQELAAGINWVLSKQKQGKSFLKECRQKSETHFSAQAQANTYIRLYTRMLGNRMKQATTPPVADAVGTEDRKSVASFSRDRNFLNQFSRNLPVHSEFISSNKQIAGRHWPKISVVTPSFNQAAFLESCISSVLDQNYPNLEYIVMDGGSTDGSKEIIEKFAGRLAYWQSQPDQGQYWAIQEGIRRSTGDIITWLNSDDLFAPNALFIAASIFLERPEIEWITGRRASTDEDGSRFSVNSQLPLWSRAKFLKQYDNPFIQQEGTFWRRSLWEKAGGVLETRLVLAGDMELWARFFRYASLYSVDYALAFYRVHGKNKAIQYMQQYKAEADTVVKRELKLLQAKSRFFQVQAPRPITRHEMAEYLSKNNFQLQPGAGFIKTEPRTNRTAPAERPKLTSRLVSIPDFSMEQVHSPPICRQEQVDRITVSFLLPTKDRTTGLVAVLESFAQAMQDLTYEILLYPGKPNDDIEHIIQAYGIKKIFYDQDLFGDAKQFSWSRLMNHGFAQASGQWIMYGSDDIVFYPYCFKNAISLLKLSSNQSVGGIAFMHRNTVDTCDGFFSNFGYDTLNGDKAYINFGMIRMDAFRHTSGFDENLRFFWSDVDICAQLWSRGYRILPSYGSLVDHNNFLEAKQKKNRAALFSADTAYFDKKWRGSDLFGNKNPLEKVRYYMQPEHSRRTIEALGPDSCRSDMPRSVEPGTEKMDIVIDGVIFQLQPRCTQGISRVWRNLIPELVRHMPHARITILQRGSFAVPVKDVFVQKIPVFALGGDDILDSDDERLRLICRDLKADIFISTYYTRAPGITNVVMVHDLIPEKCGFDMDQPEWHAKQRVMETGDAFVCVSEATRSDLMRFYPQIGKRPICIALNGLEAGFKPQERAHAAQWRQKFDLNKPCLLMVGNRHGYKNGIEILDSLSKLPSAGQYTVLCIGGERRLTAEEKALHKHPVLDVRFVGQFSDEELIAAYSGAEALLVPSRHEGFGLPVIEAMACGCPVIAHPSQAVCEVGGDAVFYADASKPDQIQEALANAGREPYRRDMIAKGLSRAARFTWKQSAWAIKTFLEDLVSQPLILLTAVVSTYNAAGFIRGCLQDLQAQTLAARMEVIVVDSASTQDEAAIVREFQQNWGAIKYIRTSVRENVYAAWNRGIKFARGQYITNANTDDRHRRDALAQMVSVMEARPEISLVYADVIKTRTANQTFDRCTPTGVLRWPDYDRQKLITVGCYIGPQPVWRRDVHDIHGYFDDSYQVSGDFDFWLRISRTSRFYHLPKPLGLYLERDDSLEHSNRDRKRDEDLSIIRKYRGAVCRGDRIGYESRQDAGEQTRCSAQGRPPTISLEQPADLKLSAAGMVHPRKSINIGNIARCPTDTIMKAIHQLAHNGHEEAALWALRKIQADFL